MEGKKKNEIKIIFLYSVLSNQLFSFHSEGDLQSVILLFVI